MTLDIHTQVIIIQDLQARATAIRFTLITLYNTTAPVPLTALLDGLPHRAYLLRGLVKLCGMIAPQLAIVKLCGMSAPQLACIIPLVFIIYPRITVRCGQ